MSEIVRVQTDKGVMAVGVDVYTFKIGHFYLHLCVYLVAFIGFGCICVLSSEHFLMKYGRISFFYYLLFAGGVIVFIQQYSLKKLVLKVSKKSGELVQLIKNEEELPLSIMTDLELIPLGVLSNELQLLKINEILYIVYRSSYAIDKYKNIDKEKTAMIQQENKKAFSALEKAVNKAS